MTICFICDEPIDFTLKEDGTIGSRLWNCEHGMACILKEMELMRGLVDMNGD